MRPDPATEKTIERADKIGEARVAPLGETR
jgi:hypothetical protein